MRTIVDLPKSQVRALDRIARRQRVSRAEVMRRAARSYAASNSQDPLDAVFGMWKTRKDIGDAQDYVNRLRDEWEGRLRELYRKR